MESDPFGGDFGACMTIGSAAIGSMSVSPTSLIACAISRTAFFRRTKDDDDDKDEAYDDSDRTLDPSSPSSSPSSASWSR